MSSTSFFFVFIPILAIILLAVNLIFAPHNPYQEKDSTFECGFHSFLGQNRTEFSISFFIFALLFLLFDLEILLVYPFVVSAHRNGIYGLWTMLIFFLALTLGFVFELGKNALKIDSRQTDSLNNDIYPETIIVWLTSDPDDVNYSDKNSVTGISSSSKGQKESVMYHISRDLNKPKTLVKKAQGLYIYSEDGRKVLDASGGALVSCLGHGDRRVIKAMIKQAKICTYASSNSWSIAEVELLSKKLIKTTNDKLARAYFCSSGSEAMDIAIKTACQFFFFKNDTKRKNIISVKPSWHGATGFSLSISKMQTRQEPYGNFIIPNCHSVSSYNPYRGKLIYESEKDFVKRLADELEAKFQELGPETVMCFVVEPVCGASGGAVPAPDGYLKAVKEICDKHGALLIFDEVMCGMGRTGHMHAWQKDDVVPDLQTLGKGLGGGYIAIAGVLVSHKVINILKSKSGRFIHAQTYQNMAVPAAVALKLLDIIVQDNLLDNVQKMGALLETRLKDALGNHPNVGDIRGRGLLYAIEYVEDKTTKKPFDPKYNIANLIKETAFLPPFNTAIYSEAGTVDGVKGDHTMIGPAYYVKEKDINKIVNIHKKVINTVFKEISSK